MFGIKPFDKGLELKKKEKKWKGRKGVLTSLFIDEY